MTFLPSAWRESKRRPSSVVPWKPGAEGAACATAASKSSAAQSRAGRRMSGIVAHASVVHRAAAPARRRDPRCRPELRAAATAASAPARGAAGQHLQHGLWLVFHPAGRDAGRQLLLLRASEQLAAGARALLALPGAGEPVPEPA